MTTVTVSKVPSPSVSVRLSAMPAPGRRLRIGRSSVFDDDAVTVAIPAWRWSYGDHSVVDAPALESPLTSDELEPAEMLAAPPPPSPVMVMVFDAAESAMLEPAAKLTDGLSRMFEPFDVMRWTKLSADSPPSAVAAFELIEFS